MSPSTALSDDAETSPPRKWWKNPWQILLSEHFRAYSSTLIGAIVFAVWTLSGADPYDSLVERVIAILGTFLLLYVVVTLVVFMRAPRSETNRWARTMKLTFAGRYVYLTQPGGGIALYFSIAALVIAIIVLPRTAEFADVLHPIALMGVVVAVVFLSWMAVAVTTAVEYLVSHHEQGPDSISFPGTEEPRFTDYLYLAIAVTASFSPPDVEVRSSVIRARMTLHMLVAFVFNTLVLATVVGAVIGSLT